MPAPLIRDPASIRLALAGMVPDDNHPYSWSAILNGYDAAAMASCPSPVITRYLAAEPPERFGIEGARVTHIWCDDPAAARHVARASLIPTVVDRPEDLLGEVGDLRLITMTTCRSWERYGIHAAEGVYPFLAPGRWETVANTGTARANIAHARHADGVDVVLAAIDDLDGAFGCLSLYGTRGAAVSRFSDSFSAFKAQLEAFVRYLRTGERPFPFDETAELVRILIAGIRSRAEGGRPVRLSEIAPEEGANA